MLPAFAVYPGTPVTLRPTWALLGEREKNMAYVHQVPKVCSLVRFCPKIARCHLEALLLEAARGRNRGVPFS
ncbi:MAG: hypothetical protein EXR50_04615 [Dehalococcoidia bacterium]|nr:hypothetical protein [Dehalococcoidia bacterium]